MKALNFILKIASMLLLVVGFTSCGDDDDGCKTCSISYGGQTYTEEVCEEDFDSQEEYNQYLAAVALLGGDCN